MKKKLNTERLANELDGASLFFTKSASPRPDEAVSVEKRSSPIIDSPAPIQTQVANVQHESDQKPETSKTVQSKSRDAATPSNQESMHASNNASMQALLPESIIETIRKAVKDVGKDSATYRFTPEEKKALLELGFSFKMQGYKTSENELIRIAINFILEDQRVHGRTSVLQRVLEALNK